MRGGECQGNRSGLPWESLADPSATRGIRWRASAPVAVFYFLTQFISGPEGGAGVNEIMIPKKWVVVVLVVIGLGAGLLWGAPKVLGRSQANVSSPPTRVLAQEAQTGQDDSVAQKAATAGAQAFYTVDFHKGQQAWLDQLCSVSTQTGCIVYQNVIGPNLWSSFEQAQTATTAKVTVQDKVDEQIAETRGNAPMQVWRLQIELSDPWPMQKEPQTVFSALALVIQEQGEWRFERFLTEEELSIFSAAGGQP